MIMIVPFYLKLYFIIYNYVIYIMSISSLKTAVICTFISMIPQYYTKNNKYSDLGIIM